MSTGPTSPVDPPLDLSQDPPLAGSGGTGAYLVLASLRTRSAHDRDAASLNMQRASEQRLRRHGDGHLTPRGKEVRRHRCACAGGEVTCRVTSHVDPVSGGGECACV